MINLRCPDGEQSHAESLWLITRSINPIDQKGSVDRG